MQLGAQLPSTHPSPPDQPVPRAASGFTVAQLPDEVRTMRIGRGTVQSEVDRTIRVRLEGTGPASTRALHADSGAARELFASPGGARFERGIRALLATADGARGDENLRSITIVPDEHASKGVIALNEALERTRLGNATPVTPADVRRLAADEPAALTYSGARKLGGNVVLLPMVARTWLATLGLYHPQADDDVTRLPASERAAAGRWSWHAAIHEVQHSISPRTRGDSREATRALEESIAEVLAPAQVAPTMRAAGATVDRAARTPRAGDAPSAVPWAAWSTDALLDRLPPTRGADDARGDVQATRRYVDGPELLAELTRAAGIDRRTTAGRAAAAQLLQGRGASFVPRRVADAIAARHGGTTDQARPLADTIRLAAAGRAASGAVQHAVDALGPAPAHGSPV
ncbi:MAG: hypothetical protein H7287_10200 [Thermoleophilia bacterium]|nr:hypothetical protein [Thermoleophilia bacterium]